MKNQPMLRVRQTEHNFFYIERKNLLGIWCMCGSEEHKCILLHEDKSDSEFAQYILDKFKAELEKKKNFPKFYY